MNAADPILELAGVVLPDAHGGAAPLAPFDLRLAPGEIARVAAPAAWGPLLADLVCGIRRPLAGTVRFADVDWAAAGPREAGRMRHRIGRVFAGAAWMSNLDVDENIILGARHYSGRRDADLLAAAKAGALQMGLPDVPAGRPAWADRRDLQLAQWIRAGLDAPALLLVEDPAEDLQPGDAPLVRAAVARAVEAGAAALAIVADEPGASAFWPECRVLRMIAQARDET